MNFIRFIWELPQNILGFILTRTKIESKDKPDKYHYIYYKYNNFGSISLGKYIVINTRTKDEETIKHETGHTFQSLYLGPLYLIIIGIPSMIGAIWDTLFHKNWSSYKRAKWYFSLPWEHWADKLGKVERKL